MSREDTSALVQRGYDRVADRYERLERPGREWPRMRWLDRLLDGVPAGAAVLDIGCGNGLPATAHIAKHHRATGVDISAVQVERARRNVPSATFVRGDLLDVDFEEPFAAIAAFYVIEHVPREQHAAIFERWHRWLAPGGRLLFTVEPYDETGHVGTWLGEPMFFSQHDPHVVLELLDRAGFDVIERAVESQFEGDHDVDYLWVLARRTGPGREGWVRGTAADHQQGADMDEDKDRRDKPEDQPGEPGAEGGSGGSADVLPAAPSDDDSALGDTDQHSDAQA